MLNCFYFEPTELYLNGVSELAFKNTASTVLPASIYDITLSYLLGLLSKNIENGNSYMSSFALSTY